MARVLSAVGRAFIGSGLLLLLFVAYQLWGTGLHEARAQDDLDREFRDKLTVVADVAKTASPAALKDPTTTRTGATTTTAPSATTTPPTTAAPTTAAPTTTTTAAVATTTDRATPVAVRPGEALARIRIPAIGVDKLVVEGVTVEDLRKAPGHYRTTPQPGYPGNTAIAGHRTTYGAPFGDIDQLVPGDQIEVVTLHGTWRYAVMAAPDDPASGHFIVSPEDVWVLKDFGDNRLTLTACHPKFSASQRIVVMATLLDTPATPPPTATPADAATVVPGDEDTDTGSGVDDATGVALADPSLDEGLGGDPSARTPALLWGLVFLLLLAGLWQLSIGRRRWVVSLAGALPMLWVLFSWFEQLDRWMPAR